MKPITFVIPSRNNLDLLKLCYKSIKDLGNDHHVLVLNDASEDGTHEWLDSLDDNNLHVYTNPGPDRVGIVGMFDKGIEIASTDVIFAFHADMVAGKKLDVNILQWLEKMKSYPDSQKGKEDFWKVAVKNHPGCEKDRLKKVMKNNRSQPLKILRNENRRPRYNQKKF